jgi:hypothetical protein
MGEKIIVGQINKGLDNARPAFQIDNDSFPTLINAYQWRRRVKRKRGTSLLGRLNRWLGLTDALGAFTTTILPPPVDPADTTKGLASFKIGNDTWTDPGGANPATLLSTKVGGAGTLNRVTGALSITGADALTAVFYFPRLPVMGLEDVFLDPTDFVRTMGFDTRWSYDISIPNPYSIHDVTFYKNPNTTTPVNIYPGYIRKVPTTPFWWNGQDYQQFWTINYEGALWATNGITIPFTQTNIGMHYKFIEDIVIDSAVAPVPPSTLGGPSVATIEITAHGLVQGDFVFINEVLFTENPDTGIKDINFQTGYVISADPQDPNFVEVEFPNAYLTGTYTDGGIAQYLTNRSDTTKDCIRYYDGDPTDGSITNPALTSVRGWVNFCPPLSRSVFSVGGRPENQWYLVGARMIANWKDRLLFFGPVIQTSAEGSQTYLQDTVIYSQNGTPFYTASFTGDPSLPTTQFFPMLVPDDGTPDMKTATVNSFWGDQTGFGGFISAGIDQKNNTIGSNKDVMILGFDRLQTKLVYTGNDIIPFSFYQVNPEYGSTSTFSSIDLDQSVFTKGTRGFIATSEVKAERIDLVIPDKIFEISNLENGTERVTSIRDYINEWIYFTYRNLNDTPKFPNQTLQYNYRDNSWAIFNESYTHYGIFRPQTGFTWATVGNTYPKWSQWNEPWNAGSSELLQPKIIGGNQQGFILFRDDGTGEGNSLYIQNIVGNLVTSPDHDLNEDDFIMISGVFGTIDGEVNNRTFQVYDITRNTFRIDPNITAGTYLGGGLIKRLYVPFIQTKQFPTAWEIGRKTRLGVQQYLLSKTDRSEITLLIYLSQNASNPYNNLGVVPALSVINNALIYDTVLYTCPESTNLGLTPANINLQMPTAVEQQQIWHRVNTSLLGDTVQLGFTMSEAQMFALFNFVALTITDITLGTDTILDAANNIEIGQLVRITGVVGTTQLNDNIYLVIDRTDSTITIDVNSTTFTAYEEGGVATVVAYLNQTAEIELFGFILDVTPSQMLS